MKYNLFLHASLWGMLLLVAPSVICAQNVNQEDTTSVVRLKEIGVVSVRATSSTPMSVSNVKKREIARINMGQDIPYILNSLPSVVVSSDAGNGVGYSSLRVRGVDASRINITANGIPLNDAEDHTLYWVDLPDLASSLQSVQMQRGAGTSTNGAAAFGATIDLQTDKPFPQPHTELDATYGTYNTQKETLSLGTGILGGHFAFDARLSNISSDGFLHRASSQMNSYMAQGAYYAGQTSLRVLVTGGKESTYHAWNYDWKPGMDRRYNSCGAMFTDSLGVTHYYPQQTDNFTQTNWQAHFNHRFNNHWTLAVALHHTDGAGFYEEYKRDQLWAAYLLDDAGQGTRSDLVRRKKCDNQMNGGVFTLDYARGHVQWTWGGGFSRFLADHWGEVMGIAQGATIQPLSLDSRPHYYDNHGAKTDAHLFGKINYLLGKGWSLFADMQLRGVHYTIRGASDDYNALLQQMQPLQVRENYNFCNPKVGVNCKLSPTQRLFASYSVAQREPSRSCFTNNLDITGKPLIAFHPRSERMGDYELGYQQRLGSWAWGVNFYYMDYFRQLVQNGQLNDIGEAVYINVPRSYRTGIELESDWKFAPRWSWQASATWSRNRIRNYEQVDVTYDADWNETGVQRTCYKSAPIAFSPDWVAHSNLQYQDTHLTASLRTHFVSRQFLTNTGQKALSIDPYAYTDFAVDWKWKLLGVKEGHLGMTVYNLFDARYETNGWGYRYWQDGSLCSDYGLAAQAGIHVMGHLRLNF